VQHYAFHRQRNPPKEWLESLEWDREERLWCLLSKGLGATHDDYSAAVGRCFMVGMVARVMNPGCKVDCMPIFEGSQGLGKSTALKIIGGPYFAEIHESITSKDFYLAIAGKMLCEISELHAFRRAEIERIKGIITTATDRFRVPFGTFAADHPRSCVFAGTTNLDDWNTDETGARRFWPVRCFDIDRDWLSEHRHQIFAEAVHRYVAGESWWDVP
jgi:putative DNA primase/helicase